MAALQIQQEVPGGKKGEDEGKVSKRVKYLGLGRQKDKDWDRDVVSVATTAEFKGQHF